MFDFLKKKKKKFYTKNTFDNESQIKTILNRLQQHLIIVTATFPDDKDVYNTSIIKTDPEQGIFYLDEFIPSNGNKKLHQLRDVILKTRLDGAWLTLNSSMINEYEENGFRYFAMRYPSKIKTIQRRQSFRIDIPIEKRIQTTMQSESGSMISGFLNDISATGLSVRIETPQNISFAIGDVIPYITTHLPESPFTCQMLIKRLDRIASRYIIGGHFQELTTQQQRLIQRFVARMDREKRKKEAG